MKRCAWKRSAFSFTAVALLLSAGHTVLLYAQTESGKMTVPQYLTDIEDRTIDVEKLAREHQLFFVTLKAVWCPVCATQLKRLLDILPTLEMCGAAFIVLSPGPRNALKAVKEQTQFPYPFVEDKELKLAKRLNMVLAPDQIQPVIFAVNAKRHIIWTQSGRSGAYYGDKELLEYLDCDLAHLDIGKFTPFTTIEKIESK